MLGEINLLLLMLLNIFLMTMQSICVFNCLSFLHCIINAGLAGKNFTEAGCSFIGSMPRIQGRWLYNSECLFLVFYLVSFSRILGLVFVYFLFSCICISPSFTNNFFLYKIPHPYVIWFVVPIVLCVCVQIFAIVLLEIYYKWW